MDMVKLLQTGQEFNRFRWVLILVAPFFLYLIPLDAIFHGTTLCLIKNTFGVECYGCGMTRALFSLLYLDFDGAFHYNRLVVIVAPVLIFIWIKSIIFSFRKRKKINTFGPNTSKTQIWTPTR